MAHIAKFVSGIWQIHPFGEGNTRTTAVFTIKYLRSIGFDVNNDLFAQHSWYFRNALVRANYRNVRKGIEPDMGYLIRFFENLMMNTTHELKNRFMIIDAPTELAENRTSTEQVPNKSTTETEQANNIIGTDNKNVLALIKVIGKKSLSVKEMLDAIGLKHRPTFIENYLKLALSNGFVRMLYPESPKHPRQKYLLTVKGLAIYNSK